MMLSVGCSRVLPPSKPSFLPTRHIPFTGLHLTWPTPGNPPCPRRLPTCRLRLLVPTPLQQGRYWLEALILKHRQTTWDLMTQTHLCQPIIVRRAPTPIPTAPSDSANKTQNQICYAMQIIDLINCTLRTNAGMTVCPKKALR